MYMYICIFFLAIVVLGVLLCIDYLMAAWHTPWPRVWFRLAGGSCFRWKPFQVSRIFQGKNLLIFTFPLSFSCYFFTFSLRLAFLTSLVAHFALSLLSFLLIFRYALYLCSFPFWISFFWVLFSFFLSVFPFPFRVVLFPLMVGYSEVERTSLSVAFLFARLGALLEYSIDPLGALSPNGSYPPIEGFVPSGSGLGLVLGDLYPLLYKS